MQAECKLLRVKSRAFRFHFTENDLKLAVRHVKRLLHPADLITSPKGICITDEMSSLSDKMKI